MEIQSIDLYKILEAIASLFGLIFLYLVIKQKKAAWYFGIIASAINVFLFINVKLYSEAVLYFIYFVLGFYGLFQWSKRNGKELKINVIDANFHLIWVLVGLSFAGFVGYYFNNFTDARYSYFDSISTSFAIIATFMEARKILHVWIYWILINTYSVFLYASVDLSIRSTEMMIYAIFSFVGFFAWRKSYKAQQITDN